VYKWNCIKSNPVHHFKKDWLFENNNLTRQNINETTSPITTSKAASCPGKKSLPGGSLLLSHGLRILLWKKLSYPGGCDTCMGLSSGRSLFNRFFLSSRS